MIRISNIKIGIFENFDIKKMCAKKARVKESDVLSYKIFRRSLDARKKDNIHYVYTVDINVKNKNKVLSKKNKDISVSPDMEYKFPEGVCNIKKSPVVVGFGPAGMFCGLLLAQMGLCPVIVERGQDVDKRTEAVNKFWTEGKLDTENNVQFGEGGAGTFSDGKLTTRIKDLRCRKVLEEFVNFGSPEEILYEQKPHIGTDILKTVVKNIRNEIIRLGGKVYFGKKAVDFIEESGKIKGVVLNDNTVIESDDVVLALGHSARDTFEKLFEKGIKMEQKPFAMGVRIEHPQSMIDISQYGTLHKKLPPADYRLTYTTSKGRGVYTFCMCPGGTVVAAASEEGMVATNGMSEYARDKENANSALLVQIYPEDFGSDHILGGMYMQRDLERKAFIEGGSNYFAPAQSVGAFMNNNVDSEFGEIKNSYMPGIKFSDIRKVLPEFMTEAIREALPEMGKRLKGFDRDDAIMTAVESRSSSPVRILRDKESFESVSLKGLYPAGEGAGYAGGIVSAAVDGIVIAEKIYCKYVY